MRKHLLCDNSVIIIMEWAFSFEGMDQGKQDHPKPGEIMHFALQNTVWVSLCWAFDTSKIQAPGLSNCLSIACLKTYGLKALYTIFKKKEEEGEWKVRHEKCIILIMLSEKVMKIFIRRKWNDPPWCVFPWVITYLPSHMNCLIKIQEFTLN